MLRELFPNYGLEDTLAYLRIEALSFFGGGQARLMDGYQAAKEEIKRTVDIVELIGQ